MRIILLLFFLMVLLSTTAQVGIGTSSPDPSSILDVSSSNGGFLPPRMSYNQRNAIISPAGGLLIWCIDCGTNGELQVSNGVSWTNVIGGPATPPPPPGIGEYYEGGIIFYFFQPGDPGYIEGESHGLIVATEDQSAGSWGCQYSTIGTSTGIGTGASNTSLIVTNCTTVGIAARNCYDLILNGFSDWYLPSKDELNKLYFYNTQYTNLVAGFTNGYYYSSSEQNLDNAYYQNPIYGGVDYGPKSWIFNVRAIRTF